MQNLLNNRSGMGQTAIYGDMNTQQATIATDLNKLNGPSLETYVDTKKFDLNQVLKLNNTVYDTTNVWMNVQSFTSNAATIQGSLDGWTPTYSWFLQIPLTLTGTFYNNDGLSNVPTPGTNILDMYNGPELAFLNIFDKIRFYMGRNNIRVGRPNAEECMILKTSGLDKAYNDIESDVVGQIGAPFSLTGNFMKSAPNTATTNAGVYGNSSAGAYSRQFIHKAWESRWRATCQDLFVKAVNWRTPAEATMELAIPCSFLHSYLNTEPILPPNLPIKFEMSFKSGSIPLCMFAAANLVPDSNYRYKTMAVSATVNTSNIKFFYRRHLLNADVQQQINNEWITKRFLTNYNTYEYQEYVGNGSSKVTMNITISQQRPIQLIMKVVPTSTTVDHSKFFYVAYPDSISPYHSFSYVNINIGGRNKIEYNNQYVTNNQQVGMRKCQDAQNAYINAKQYESKIDMGKWFPFQSEMQSNFIGGYEAYAPTTQQMVNLCGIPLVFTINPGDFVDVNDMSTDQGATSITLDTEIIQANVSFGQPNLNPNASVVYGPMTSAYKLVVVKKYPEQLTIAQDLNISLVQWPAVYASNNNVVISNTFNNN